MEKYFVTYEQALALKELGFDEPCLKLWEKTILFTSLVDPSEFKKVVSERYTKAPLKAQVFEWFRKDYKKLPAIDHSSINGWYFVIREIGGTTDPMLKAVSVGNFKTYEEAESVCIDKLIEIVQNLNKQKT
jgi:hypothetical protein